MLSFISPKDLIPAPSEIPQPLVYIFTLVLVLIYQTHPEDMSSDWTPAPWEQGMCFIFYSQHLTTSLPPIKCSVSVKAVSQDFPSAQLFSLQLGNRKQRPQQRGNPEALPFILGHNGPTSK